MKPEEFLDLIPDYPGREREEPAILIGREYCVLVLKRDKRNVCCFHSGSGCSAYGSRPMLCRSYPFRVPSFQCTVLEEMKSRQCPRIFSPQGKEKEQYVSDCREYLSQLQEYKRIAEKWNEKGGGSFREFMKLCISLQY